MTELRVVRGSWPRPASIAPVLNDSRDGTEILGCHIVRDGKFDGPARRTEKTSPTQKITSAYGKRENRWVKRSAMKAAIAQKRLSAHDGEVQPRGLRRDVPADRTNDSPAPTWIPFTTGVGMALVNQCSNPVMLNNRTVPDTKNPADTVSATVKDLEMATAAIAYYFLSF